ncbi:hypothetical protein BSKO_10688 [Bryopsis sp. KO-2023]|nr:hypothetical protein BSKO_10688 [Bryopsis sp. KO-2023]
MVQQLIKNGANVDSIDYDGRTALHLAASEGQLVTAYTLIHRCDASNTADRWGDTPVSHALQSGHIQTARLILSVVGGTGCEKEASLWNTINSSDPTPLRQIRKRVISQLNKSHPNSVANETAENFGSLTYEICVRTIGAVGKAAEMGANASIRVSKCDVALKALNIFLTKIFHKGSTSGHSNVSHARMSRDLKKRQHTEEDWAGNPMRPQTPSHGLKRYSSSSSIQLKLAQPINFLSFDKLLLKLGNVESIVRKIKAGLANQYPLSTQKALELASRILEWNLSSSDISKIVSAVSSAPCLPSTSDPAELQQHQDFVTVPIPALFSSTIIQSLLKKHQNAFLGALSTPSVEQQTASSMGRAKLCEAIELIATIFSTFDTAKKGFIDFSDVRRAKSDIREIGLAVLEKAVGKFDTQVKGSINKTQFVQGLLDWMDISSGANSLDGDPRHDLVLPMSGNSETWLSSLRSSRPSSLELTLATKQSTLDHFVERFKSVQHRSDSFFRRERMMSGMQGLLDESKSITSVIEQIKTLFKMLDSDGKGYITFREADAVVSMLEGTLGMDFDFMRKVLRKLALQGSDGLTMNQFISLAIPEPDPTEEKQEAISTRKRFSLVIMPNSYCIQIWDAFIRWLAVFFFVDVPTQIAFRTGRPGTTYFIVSNIFDCLLIVDMIMNFFRAYLNKKSVIVTSYRRIARHYLASKFLMDFIAACPLDLLVMVAGASHEYTTWMRIFKLLRLHRLLTWYKKKESDANADSVFARIKLLAPIIFGISHIMACVWWYIGTIHLWSTKGDPEAYEIVKNKHWVNTYDGFGMDDVFLEGNFGQQYLVSFYWITATLSTNGQIGNMYPQNLQELVFTSICMLVTLTVYAYVLGEVSNLVMNQDEELIQKRSQLQTVQKFVASHQLPDELTKGIILFFDNSHAPEMESGAKDIFNKLSHTLQVEVAKHMSRKLVGLVTLFFGCNERFLDSLSVLLHEVTVQADTHLFHRNDVARELYIVSSGVIELTTDDPAGEEMLESARSAGRTVGELSFFFGMNYTMHARTPYSMPASLFVLQVNDFHQLAKLYPNDVDIIRENVLKMCDALHMGNDGKIRNHLHIAREKKRRNCIQRLVEAAARGDIGEVNMTLATNEVNVDDGDEDKRTALHLASSNGHVDLTRNLVLVQRAYVNVKDIYGGTPIMDALRHKHHEIVMFLRHHGASLHPDKIKSDLFKAAAEGDVNHVQLLVQTNVDLNALDHNCRSILHIAAARGHLDLVQYLCLRPEVQKSPVDLLGGTPLYDSIRHCHKDIQECFASFGVRLYNVDLGYKLCSAAAENDLETIKVYDRNGANLNSTDYYLRTALHLGAANGSTEVALYLLKKEGLLINPVDRKGCTPLDDAIRSKSVVIQTMLEQAGGRRGEELKSEVAHNPKDERYRLSRRLQRMIEESVEGKAVTQVWALCTAIRRIDQDLIYYCLAFHWMLQEVLFQNHWMPPSWKLKIILKESSRQLLDKIDEMESCLAKHSTTSIVQSCSMRFLCKDLLRTVKKFRESLEVVRVAVVSFIERGYEMDQAVERWQRMGVLEKRELPLCAPAQAEMLGFESSL